MKKSKLYTRTGDRGMTTMADGARVSKGSEDIEAYGTIDELNCNIGYLVSLLPSNSEIVSELEHIQTTLFEIGNELTQSPSSVNPNMTANGTSLSENTGCIINHPDNQQSYTPDVSRLELLIDETDAELPELCSFILPGGTPASAYAHVCRAVCRRLERSLVRLSDSRPVPHVVIIYVNRLSDYFFVLARKLNFIDKIPEKTIAKTCR